MIRTLVRLVVVVAAFSVGLGAAAAYGARAQDGRNTHVSHVDGTLAYVIGDDFGPPANQCVLYSILATDFTHPRQVEAGVVRCDNGTIDGTCHGGHGFVEVYSPSVGYQCNQGQSFSNGSSNYAIVSRNSNTSTDFGGAILGTSNAISGFVEGDDIYAFAWAEATGSAPCPGGNPSGRFLGWNKLIAGSGWSIVSNSDEYHGTSSHCWHVHNVGGAGGFSVD